MAKGTETARWCPMDRGHYRYCPALCFERRSHPQGWEARRPTSAESDQIWACGSIL